MKQWNHSVLGTVFVAALPLGALILAAGCSHPQDMGGGPPPGGGGPGGGPRRGPGAIVAANATGAEIYAQKCQGCHGDQGQGRRGPSLQKAAGGPVASIVQIVHNGHGRMPAFGSQLTPDQITRVADYVKQLKPG